MGSYSKLEGDGRLSCREMGGYVGGRWVAKLWGDGCMAKLLGRCMGD